MKLIIETTAELLAYLDDGYILRTAQAQPLVWRPFVRPNRIRTVPVLPRLVDGHLIGRLQPLGHNDWQLI